MELITTETRIDDNPVSEVERIAVHNKIKYNFELTKEEVFVCPYLNIFHTNTRVHAGITTQKVF